MKPEKPEKPSNDNTPDNLVSFARRGAPPPPQLPEELVFEKLPDNCEVLPLVTTHDIPVARVLQQALDAGLEEVVVVGYTDRGTEFFMANVADGAAVLWHLERAKIKLLTERNEDGTVPG